MKINVKIIALSVVAAVLVSYLVAVAVWANRCVNTNVCSSIQITIVDSVTRTFVTKTELVQLLRTKGVYPVGHLVRDISAQHIEDIVLAHPMVRKAECYITPSGEVRIRLSQRIPILRVVTGSESYFVDSDNKRMPIRESVTTPVIWAEGTISERMACHELADLARWMAHDAYWKERISSIHVVNPRYIYLVQEPDKTKIILGDIQGYSHKLHKLHRLYDKGFESIGWRTYQEIDLRYQGQVIGRN